MREIVCFADAAAAGVSHEEGVVPREAAVQEALREALPWDGGVIRRVPIPRRRQTRSSYYYFKISQQQLRGGEKNASEICGGEKKD